MKIRWHTMGGTNHSWSFVAQALARAMKNTDHEVYFKSTNNLEHFPADLKDTLLPGYHGILVQGDAKYLDGQGNETTVPQKNPEPEIPDTHRPYDLELAYTIPYQGPRRFYNESRCRAIIWNFESSILPPGWQYYARSVDYILPSSQFSYDIFVQNGIPKEKLLVVPHGVDTKIFNPEIPPFKLKTKKRVKFLHNAIPHHRKLHDRVIKGFVDTFTDKDDVCLVLKTKFVKPSKEKLFEVDVKDILTKVLKGKKNPPEIEVINTFIPDIGSLYTACDAVVSMSATEGFCLPLLEALACDTLVIAPRHGGQLDFLNDENSILIDTGEMKAPPSTQYWVYMEDAVVGDPDINHYKEVLRRVYENTDGEKERVKKAAKSTVEKFTWEAAAQMILDLPIPKTSARIHSKRKVLYIIPYKMVGGGEVWIREAVKDLDRSIYEPHIAFVSGITTDLEKLFEGLDVTFEDLSNSGRDMALKCLVESGGFDIIHFYNSFGVYRVLHAACRQGLRCRVVETVHSELSWNDSMTKVSTREPLVTVISAVSNRMARKLLKNGNKNVVMLPQNIDWDRFLGIPRSKDILDEFQIPKSFVVGFVGRLSPEKNIPVLIECAKMMPDISFVIVGDGPQDGPLKIIAKELKNVFFVGRKNDLEKWYPAFDVLMLPSLMEGMPLVILEAMSAGTPVIASDVGAIVELVLDGITGNLVWNPNNPGLFASSIYTLKTNEKLWESYSKNAKMVAAAFKERSNSFNINNLYKMMFNGG
jgi:glycosyltransferase involved in cell wall biosynthesis